MSIEGSRKLIKGRIAEVVFEEMMRAEKRHTIIPFGYEHTLPTLAQYQDLTRVQQVMDKIKDAPDFVLISEDKSKIYLVEVKYQSVLSIEWLRKYAERLNKRWSPAWLFIATPKGFYCSLASSVLAGWTPRRLSEKWVVKSRQDEYLMLLNEFQNKKIQ